MRSAWRSARSASASSSSTRGRTRSRDRDRLRFMLTGEAGLNDGTAFPFVMLGLGLLGARDLGEAGWRWLVVDAGWATGGGLAIYLAYAVQHGLAPDPGGRMAALVLTVVAASVVLHGLSVTPLMRWYDRVGRQG